MTDFTPHQQKVIKRYYDNQDTIQRQRLGDLVSKLYLAEGKQKARLWTSAASAMEKLGVPKSRVEHLVHKANPALLAELVKELERRP